MSSREVLHVGERIEVRRKQRGMSRSVLAALLGRSEEWLRQVESGSRSLAGVDVLVRLAEILQIERLEELIGWSAAESRPTACVVESARSTLFHAITDHPTMEAYGANPALHQDPEQAKLLGEDIDECWRIWCDSPTRYTQMVQRLPGLMANARTMHWQTRTDVTRALLTKSYHLARFVLARLGDRHLAWLAADRAQNLASAVGSPTLAAAAAWHFSAALLSMDHFEASRQYAHAAANRLAADAPLDQPLHGALQLLQALAAAGPNDERASTQLMLAAIRAGDRVGEDVLTEWIWFGPTEIAIARVQQALRLGRLNDAVRLAAEFEMPHNYPAARRARHYLTSAYAFARRGDDGAAVFALLSAEKACPEDIRYDWTAHRSLQHLIRRGSRLVRSEVQRLSALAGLL